MSGPRVSGLPADLAMEDKWEFARPGEELKYNAMENEWEYAQPDAALEYNPMEDTWGFDPKDDPD